MEGRGGRQLDFSSWQIWDSLVIDTGLVEKHKPILRRVRGRKNFFLYHESC